MSALKPESPALVSVWPPSPAEQGNLSHSFLIFKMEISVTSSRVIMEMEGTDSCTALGTMSGLLSLLSIRWLALFIFKTLL